MRQARAERNAAPVLRAMRPAGEAVSLPRRSGLAEWLTDPADWDGEGAAVLLLADASQTERRTALRALLASISGQDGPDVSILHPDGRGPIIRGPSGETRRPALSSASRGPLAAVSVSAEAAGIDVEAVADPDGIPWGVLHPAEALALRERPDADRREAFARIWSAKEAYLKALRVGLSRDPAGFEIELGPDDRTSIPADRRAALETLRVELGGDAYVVTLCRLQPANAT